MELKFYQQIQYSVKYCNVIGKTFCKAFPSCLPYNFSDEDQLSVSFEKVADDDDSFLDEDFPGKN